MPTFSRRCRRASAIAVLLSGGVVQAAVNFSLTDSDATPNFFVLRPVNANSSIMPTGSFVTLNLNSTGDPLTGVQYRFSGSGPIPNVIRYTNRELAGSSYPDPIRDDPTVEAVAVSTLDPESGEELGSSVSDVSSPTLQGTFMIARYVFSAANYTPGAIFTINTISESTAGPPPDFNDGVVNSGGTFRLVMPLRGDANRDLVVNHLDFNIVHSNFSRTATGRNWDQGDFNHDGRVNFTDFQIVEQHFGQSIALPADVPLEGSIVPEPASLALIGVAGALLLRRRGRLSGVTFR
jgi:hypothetical protein